MNRLTKTSTWHSWRGFVLAACLLSLLIGCADKTDTTTPAASIDGSKFLLTSEPADAVDVIKVREEAKDGDDVVILGRIGGSENPWVEGRAAFSIVDPSLKSCKECGSDDCPKPWDYC